jgi:flagellar biosynthesis component FlhA
MTDIPSLLLKQLDKEKLVQSLFQQARLVVEQNQAKGILAKMKTMEIGARDMAKERSSTLRVLGRLEIDEGRHIELVQNIISELNLPMQ